MDVLVKYWGYYKWNRLHVWNGDKEIIAELPSRIDHRKYCLSDYVIGNAKRLLFGEKTIWNSSSCSKRCRIAMRQVLAENLWRI